MAVIGIDLGTSTSVVAWLNGMGKPAVLTNAEGDPSTPSVVFFEGPNNKVVGRVAKQNAIVYEGQIVECVKGAMGKDLNWTFFGESYTVEQVAALILKKLASDAELALKEPIEGVVITVPACFGGAERNATRNAASIAGLCVLGILDEPLAAAIAYGFGRQDAKEARRTTLVYHLGGGTFDVAMMRLDGSEFSVLWTDGDRSLGGRNWDERIVKHISGELEKAHGEFPMDDSAVRQEIWLRAEILKKQLSIAESSPIVCRMGEDSVKVEISREKFDELTADLLERTKDITEGVVRKLRENETLPGGWDDVDEIFLVGGSTRMRQVKSMLHELTGKEPVAFDQDRVIAYGAAIYAVERLLQKPMEFWQKTNGSFEAPVPPSPIRGYEAEERISPDAGLTNAAHKPASSCSFSLGIQMVDESGKPWNSILMGRGTLLPARQVRLFTTTHDGQRAIEGKLFEGENADPAHCVALGDFAITLPPGLPVGAPVDVTFEITDEADVRIAWKELTGGRSGEYIVSRGAPIEHRIDRGPRTITTGESLSGMGAGKQLFFHRVTRWLRKSGGG
ncbi:MAG: Hsp70 family protein [Fimbriimonadaceae bacterium]|nr:Hsp70 family protein [Fimbriimonadaceae bacterium]QOJ10772.1 MAG: Hsp70 family protein [Chthonomonadaceae bacterium]